MVSYSRLLLVRVVVEIGLFCRVMLGMLLMVLNRCGVIGRLVCRVWCSNLFFICIRLWLLLSYRCLLVLVIMLVMFFRILVMLVCIGMNWLLFSCVVSFVLLVISRRFWWCSIVVIGFIDRLFLVLKVLVLFVLRWCRWLLV